MDVGALTARRGIGQVSQCYQSGVAVLPFFAPRWEEAGRPPEK